jgi:phosphoglycolate phosphatase
VAYKAIIFDLDGTLVDTVLDLANAMNFALVHFGRPTHSVEACKQMVGNGLKTFAQRALAKDRQHLQGEVLSIMKARYHDKCLESSGLYDGIVETVKKLRLKGLRLAVLTNKDQDDARRIVEHFFGADTFEYVVGTTENKAVKPGAAATIKIVESMGLATKDFLFIGDSAVDIQTAATAGIRSVGVSWGFRGKDELLKAKADIVIDSPTEILDLVA